MDAGVAEAYARSGCGQHHPGAGVAVGAVGDRALEVGAYGSHRMPHPDVGERVGALVVRPRVGRRRYVPPGVRDRRESLGSVEEGVDARRRRHRRRHPERQIGIAEGDERAQARVRDAGLDLLVGQVEYRHGGHLRAGSGGRRDREQGQYGPGGASASPSGAFT